MMNTKKILDDMFVAHNSNIHLMESDSDEQSEPLKPHVLRRNIEDYLERKALEKKLKDVFEDDYPLD
jgi:Skp family chaperone for outer membrane proteins